MAEGRSCVHHLDRISRRSSKRRRFQLLGVRARPHQRHPPAGWEVECTRYRSFIQQESVRQRPARPSEQTEDSLDRSSVQHVAIPPHHGVGLEKRIERCFLGRLGDRFEDHIEG